MADDHWTVRLFMWAMIIAVILSGWILGAQMMCGWYPVRESPLDTGRWTRPPAPPPPPAWPPPRKPGEGWAHQTPPVELCPCGWPCLCYVEPPAK